jgi:hypothetical protein
VAHEAGATVKKNPARPALSALPFNVGLLAAQRIKTQDEHDELLDILATLVFAYLPAWRAARK